MSNITFNGVDLSTKGLVTPGVRGVHDLAGIVAQQTFVPGYALPNETVLRDELVTMQIHGVVAANSHSDLVTTLATLRGYVSPRLGWKYLTVADVSAKRTLARFEGFPVSIDELPYYQTWVEFDLTALRAPWWEDATAQTDSNVTNGETIANSGGLVCYPTWTLTSTGANAGGVTLTVGGRTFRWDAAFPSGHVLIVETELPTVKYDGTANYAGVADDCEFPTFAVGNNTVTFTGSMTVAASWRRRYE